MSNITNFLDSFSKTELARPAYFDVTIFPTSVNLVDALATASLKAGKLDITEGFKRIALRCEASELPSRSFSNISQKTYGPEKLFPIQTVYSKINLTFMCSDDMYEKWIFDSWMNYMSNASFFPFPTGIMDVIDMFMEGSPTVNYDFQYKNHYESFILITQYNNKGDPSYYSGLFHAFPVSVNELPLAWNNPDSYHRLTVTFAYTYFNSATSLGGFPII